MEEVLEFVRNWADQWNAELGVNPFENGFRYNGGVDEFHDIPTPCRAPMSPEMAQRYRDAAARTLARLAADHVANLRTGYRRGQERGRTDPAPSGERLGDDSDCAGRLRVSSSWRRSESESRMLTVPAMSAGYNYYSEPPRLLKVGRGYHCVVACWIGQQRFRLTVDSGCARNFVRTQFSRQLEKHPKTKDFLKERFTGDREINCVGIVSNMKTPAISNHQTISLTLKNVCEQGLTTKPDCNMDVVFGEIDSAADGLLIGFPTLLEWGYSVYLDSDGKPWMYLRKFDVTLPCETPSDVG